MSDPDRLLHLGSPGERLPLWGRQWLRWVDRLPTSPAPPACLEDALAAARIREAHAWDRYMATRSMGEPTLWCAVRACLLAGRDLALVEAAVREWAQ